MQVMSEARPFHVLPRDKSYRRERRFSSSKYWDVFFILVCSVMVTRTQSARLEEDRENVDSRTYKQDGVICFKCEPGTYVREHCPRDFTNSTCAGCPTGTYQSAWTQADHCGQCHKHCRHDSKMIVVKHCSKFNDLTCECPSGFYLNVIDEFSDIKQCEPHTRCNTQQIVIRNGTSSTDTVCALCPPNFYKQGNNCQECTSCAEKNLTQSTPCSSTTDAVCQESHTSEVTPENVSSTPVPRPLGISISALVSGVTGGVVVVVTLIGVLRWCRKRRAKKRYTTQNSIELATLSSSGNNLLQRSLSSSSGSATTTTKRLRTLSENSMTGLENNTTGEPRFPKLQDPDTWKIRVFTILTKRLGRNWQLFVTNLPGNKDWKSCIGTRCEQITMECQGVRNQIYKALLEWSERNAVEHVTVDNVLSTLYRMGDCDYVYEEIYTLCDKLNCGQSNSGAVSDQTENIGS